MGNYPFSPQIDIHNWRNLSEKSFKGLYLPFLLLLLL